MTKERFAKIKKEYNMTGDEIDRAISVVIALLDEQINEIGDKPCYNEVIGDLDLAADKVAELCEYIEEVM